MAVTQAVQNSFTKGLLTEFTGLNFPENAATDTVNCEYTLIGNVLRREGINYEVNGSFNPVSTSNLSISSYKWNNAGGDGNTQIVVEQIGGTLYFYVASSTTSASPLSNHQLTSTVNISSFVAVGGTFDPTQECQYTDGNGYLFVYHPTCDPFYCTYTAGTIVGNSIVVQIRDFIGIPETLAITSRPPALSSEHQYNLTNQGWTQGSGWTATSNSFIQLAPSGGGTNTFTVASSLPIAGGDIVNGYCYDPNVPFGYSGVAFSGVVASYSGTTLVITITGGAPGFSNRNLSNWGIYQLNQGHINTWFGEIGNYPSNADVWWSFKNTTNIFDPTTTVANVTLSNVQAPQGHYLLNAFNQNRALVANIPSLTSTTTTARPRIGTWFQGRVWYAGVDAQQVAQGDAPYFTWTETIYFSQIVQTPSDFGNCFQVNDPTSEQLFDLLPTDGGTIQIQGSGSIYKLFPIQNGMLVFAANGIWFITGSQGIGFSANDYTITKISSVRSISSYSFVNVQGLPFFWNEEGIYAVEPTQGGAMTVDPLTVGTILSFYNKIPRSSIKYARGDYDPINYIIQWIFRSTQETSIIDRYSFDSILNFNTYNKAFFPYVVDSSVNSIKSILYVSSPGGTNAPDAILKYLASNGSTISFADEHDEAFVDWGNLDFISSFTTGYRLAGKSLLEFQPSYIYMYSNNINPTAYYIQGIWNYANTGNSGRWSTRQQINNFNPSYDIVIRKHKIRGRGLVLQIKVTSVSGQPFDIIGWSNWEQVNQNI